MGDIASISLPAREDVSSPSTGRCFVSPHGDDSCPRAVRAATSRGRRGRRRIAVDPLGVRVRGQASTTARYFFFLLFLFFFSLFLLQSTTDGRFLRQSIVGDRNRSSAIEIDRRQLKIDHRRSILAVPPDSGRSVYQSATGPVRTGQYRDLPLDKENLGMNKVIRELDCFRTHFRLRELSKLKDKAEQNVDIKDAKENRIYESSTV
ncbi:hypothetical protein BHE74_00019460 [Ensete ventricosum]|nr:hypothetical protein GW17_00009470 [Ensete ventricosum]RWW72717.1 hypothetical protein BHE74_00019460 [Ensete ventricosum]RZS01228.1 hypothetical protein BHM03_00031048 [Ensete ventricosum]